ncbi:MAG: tRNA guanosine(34) transglycosylase Tgt [Candidatus Omnitrophica bacterium]|nr:tRNA guanosine(34) transglycosylase Tgt [Candidatus Omnitrophota bacterium]MCB9746894.1 tRNA guanosine(34) transglycosylase Tgt [Candidatus Omnitrophota bacterium]
MFELHKTDKNTKARRATLSTAHGPIQTPFFMPVGTTATLKSLTFEDLNDCQAQIVLSNTYHLYLRPGMEVIESFGGLHGFMNWDKPILTDSGGYQVFSLAKLRKIKEEGVEFQSHLDGSRHFFTPEKVMDIEMTLGSDMIMPLDVCAPYPCEKKEAKESVERTTQWARRTKDYFLKKQTEDKKQYLFGIIQGAIFKDLREQSAREILDIGFDAYAIGGVSVGEPVKDMFETLAWVEPLLPVKQPRYFMGIGLPDQIVKAVGMGIDMFDTCIPTRYGRHGTAFTHQGRFILRNAEHRFDQGPIEKGCECLVCQRYSRGYIRHLASINELTALRLISYHNLHFYIQLMKEIRSAVDNDNYANFQKEFLSNYGSELSENNK